MLNNSSFLKYHKIFIFELKVFHNIAYKNFLLVSNAQDYSNNNENYNSFDYNQYKKLVHILIFRISFGKSCLFKCPLTQYKNDYVYDFYPRLLLLAPYF